MKKNHQTDPLDLLNEIKQVDAPPFLFTRISAKIEQYQHHKVSKPVVWTMGLSFLLLLTFNLSIVLNSNNTDNMSEFAEEMNLITTYSLYE